MEMLVMQYSNYVGKNSEQSVQTQKNLIKRQETVFWQKNLRRYEAEQLKFS